MHLLTCIPIMHWQFKLQVRRELDDFKTRLTSSHWSNSPGSHSLQAIAQELHTRYMYIHPNTIKSFIIIDHFSLLFYSKRLLRGDIDSVQEDISSLRSKLSKYLNYM